VRNRGFFDSWQGHLVTTQPQIFLRRSC
jgi:hypothetical protein